MNMSQGGVAMDLRCGGIFVNQFTAEFMGKRILKRGQHLSKLQQKYKCPVFDFQ